MKEKIKELISKNQTSDALSLLIDLSKPNKQIHDALLIVSGEFTSLSAERLRGIVNNEEARLRLNIINDKLLLALDSFNNEGTPLPGKVISKKERSKKVDNLPFYHREYHFETCDCLKCVGFISRHYYQFTCTYIK